MLERERHTTVLRLLSQSGFVSVADMVRLLGISEATIRRDLAKLAGQGMLKRCRGGAELSAQPAASSPAPPRLPGLPLESRIGIMAEKKRMIARAAVSLIAAEETVIIDGGSTTYFMTEFLQGLTTRIITNSFAIAGSLVNGSRNTVIIAGGMVYPDSQLTLDPFETIFYENYYASKVFMGVEGIDENGATNSDPLLIKTERKMIERGRELVLLADSSKFSQRGSLFLCGFGRIHTIITDRGIPQQSAEMIAARNVKLVVV